ncbi:MAG: YraN family protein [Candidatus Omnitrophota bacterium]
MVRNNVSVGKDGEDIAVDFLKKNGYRILKRNYRTKLGEIDIIAREKDTLCFVEVKARSSLDFGAPQEAISISKQRQLSKAALAFLKEHNSLNNKSRFDVICITGAPEPKSVDLIKNAFDLDSNFSC